MGADVVAVRAHPFETASGAENIKSSTPHMLAPRCLHLAPEGYSFSAIFSVNS
jgi:hypothetical protein